MELRQKLALIWTKPEEIWGDVIPMNNHLSALIGEYYLTDIDATRRAMNLSDEFDAELIKESLYSRILLMRLFITEDQLYTLITRYTSHLLKASNWLATLNLKIMEMPLIGLQSMWTCMLVNLAILADRWNPTAVIETVAADVLDDNIITGVLKTNTIEMVCNDPKYKDLDIKIAVIVGSAKRVLSDYNYCSTEDTVTLH